MNDENIKELSNNLIFTSIENEASSKYDDLSKLLINDEYFKIETFSNHSFIKSITLFNCFKKFEENYDPSIKDYVRYISENMKYIDLTKFESRWGHNKFSHIINFVIMTYFENKKHIQEALNFMYDFLFFVIESKNKKAIAKFIEAMCSVFCLNEANVKTIKTCEKLKLNDMLYDVEYILFYHLMDAFKEMLKNEKLLWSSIFDTEQFIPFYSDYKDLLDYIEIKNHCPKPKSTCNYKEKIKEMEKLHHDYLNDAYQFLRLINKKNKESYLKKFKEKYDPFSYILISEYLPNMKKYLKKELSNYEY